NLDNIGSCLESIRVLDTRDEKNEYLKSKVMDRRKSLKAMVAGTVTSGFMFSSCLTDTEEKTPEITPAAPKGDDNYDTTRTVGELQREKDLRSKDYFN